MNYGSFVCLSLAFLHFSHFCARCIGHFALSGLPAGGETDDGKRASHARDVRESLKVLLAKFKLLWGGARAVEGGALLVRSFAPDCTRWCFLDAFPFPLGRIVFLFLGLSVMFL